jgi:hemolysin D
MAQQETDFLPAALEIQEKPPSPAGRAIVWSVMAFFTIAVVWAMVGEIDIVATAQGKIIPSGRVKVIQPVDFGVVRHIPVKEGQHVKAGDLLIELDPTSTQADLGRLEMELLAARLDEARYRQLKQLTDGESGVKASSGLALQLPAPLAREVGAGVISLQNQMLSSEWSEHRARLAALDSTIESRQADLAATRNEVKKLEGTLPLISRRANVLKGLVAKKLSAEQAWLELEEKRVIQQHELAMVNNRCSQVESSIREALQQRQALGSEFRRRLLSSLSETRRRIDQLHQEQVKATQLNELQRLTAPVSGVVQQLAVHTIGGVVTPAQELMKIVPESEILEVEAWILNKDIGFVDEGQAVEVKIETFPFTRYGTIDAEMVDVSNDAVTDEENGLVYAGRLLMQKSAIQIGEKLVNLTPGMAVTVEIKTGKRRLIEYVLSPLLRYRQESLGER